MANTIYYTSPTYKDANNKTSETVNTSICPTGWRLPYGRNTGNGAASGGFYNLDTAIRNGETLTNVEASNRWRSYPNNFVMPGSLGSSSSPTYRGSYGYYISSTSDQNYTGLTAYYLIINKTGVSPGNGTTLGRDGGYSVRCVKIAN